MKNFSMLIVGALLGAILVGAGDMPAELPEPVHAGRFPHEKLPESSGLVASAAHKGVFWTLNDSGNAAEIFAVKSTGEVLAAVKVPGASNIDWEDLAIDEQGRLVIGDVGDNVCARKEVVLYRFPEPDPAKPAAGNDGEKAQVFRFTYPRSVGPQNVEALIARGGYAYFFTKEINRTRCLRIPLPEKPPAEAVAAELLEETAKISLVTGASLSRDGKNLALLSYTGVLAIKLAEPFAEALAGPPAKDAAPAPRAPRLFDGEFRQRHVVLGQAEAIAWEGADLLISCEYFNSIGGDLWRIEGAARE